MKSAKRNTCRIADAPAEDHRKQNHCEIEKRRRDKMNHYITKLASMIPTCSSMPCRLDKLTVLRMAVQHIKSIRSSLCGFSSFHLRPSFLSSGNLLKNLNLQMAAQEVQDNLFLVVSCDRGKVLFVSESSKDVLLYDQRELMGQSLFDILHKEDVTKVKEQISLCASPKEMLVDSKTLQPLRGSRQAMHQSQNNATGSTPQPGARRSFFCRIKTGHLRLPRPPERSTADEMVRKHQDHQPRQQDILIHQREEEEPANHKQHCQSDRHQSTHSQRVSQSTPANKKRQHDKTIQDQQQHSLDINDDAIINQNPLPPIPIASINKNGKFSSGKGHAKYIVMRCTGYLKAVTLRDDEFAATNDMDDSTSGNDSLDEDTGGKRKVINCLVAVCRRVPVDKDFKPDRPITFTCRYSVDGKFVFADQRATVALGYLPQELLGTSHYEYCNPEHYKIVSDCHKQSLQKGEPVSSDVYQFRRKNGSYIWLQTRLKSFRNPWTKYIEFLVASHTTAEEVGPVHYSEGCVPTKFNQDITAAQTQSCSPSSSFSPSTPSMGSKKSSSPSSSSMGSSYSMGSWSQNGVSKMLNNSSVKVERAKVVQSISKRVMESYRKQTDKSRATRSDSLGHGSGSSADNGTEDSGSYSDPSSCSSLSPQNSIASSELQMLSNYVESVNNVVGNVRSNVTNINAQATNPMDTNQPTSTAIRMCDNDSGTSSAYNTSSSLSGGTSSISGASGSGSSATGKSPNSSASKMARLTGKNKTTAGNSRHYHHHHHHHYHHHGQSRSRSSASSDTGVESGSWGSSESSLFTATSVPKFPQGKVVTDTNSGNSNGNTAFESKLSEARVVEAMNVELGDLSELTPIIGSSEIGQKQSTLLDVPLNTSDMSIINKNIQMTNTIQANTISPEILIDMSLLVNGTSDDPQEKFDSIISSTNNCSGNPDIGCDAILNSSDNHHDNQQSSIMQQLGLSSVDSLDKDQLSLPAVEVPVVMENPHDSLGRDSAIISSEYLNPQIGADYGASTIDSMAHMMQSQVTSHQPLDQGLIELPSVPYDYYSMAAPLQSGPPDNKNTSDQTTAYCINQQQLTPTLSTLAASSSSYDINTDNNNENSYCSGETRQHLPIMPSESNTDLNNIGVSSLFEEIDDDALLEYVANLDSDTEFSNLPIWHLSCGRF